MDKRKKAPSKTEEYLEIHRHGKGHADNLPRRMVRGGEGRTGKDWMFVGWIKRTSAGWRGRRPLDTKTGSGWHCGAHE